MVGSVNPSSQVSGSSITPVVTTIFGGGAATMIQITTPSQPPPLTVVTSLSGNTGIISYSPKMQLQFMYEDARLPVYVDYIGSIMPILDRQSIMMNWPPTPHPASEQMRLMPYNNANLPTVPYLLNVGNQRLLPEPIQGDPALSDLASIVLYRALGTLVFQNGTLP